MKILIASVVLLAMMVVLMPAADAFDPSQDLRCVKLLLDTLTQKAAGLREWSESVHRRFEQLQAYREHCESIANEFLKTRCLNTYEKKRKLEVLRLLAEVNRKRIQFSDLADQVLSDFKRCRAL